MNLNPGTAVIRKEQELHLGSASDLGRVQIPRYRKLTALTATAYRLQRYNKCLSKTNFCKNKFN
jgi:hypothetical protein